MSIIFVLIPIAVIFVLIGLGIFFWAVRSKQFDDLDKEAYSILFDTQNKPTAQPQTLSTTTAEVAKQQADPAQTTTEQATAVKANSEPVSIGQVASESTIINPPAQPTTESAESQQKLDDRTSNPHSG